MMKRTPKSECIRKIEQDRSILKILMFGQHLHKSQLFLEIGCLHNFRASNEEMGPKIGMYSKNWVGQVHFEIFDFLVMVKGPLNQRKPFFFFFLFLFFFFKFQAVRIRVKLGRPGLNGQTVWRMTSSMTSQSWGRVWHVWMMMSSMTS